jgi:curved DNA-binding protein CbpA
MKNPYKILGISRSANKEIVRNKYIQLSKQFHPDISKYNLQVSENKMKQINNAYSLIKKSIARGVIAYRPRGKFTKNEINELIERFNEGQSLYKIGRDMKRKQRSIKKHLIAAGLLEEEIYDYHHQDCSFNIIYLLPKYSLLFLLIITLLILNQWMIFWLILMSAFTYFIIDL